MKKRSGHHRLGFWLSVVTAVLVVLGMIVLTLLPFAMEWGAERMLLRFGAKTAGITDVNFNPMTGHLTVFDLQVEGPNADRVAMERLVVRMDLFRLFKKRLYFREITLIGFSLDVRQGEDGTLTFAGLSIPETQKTEGSEPEVKDETTPWGLGLRNLDVKELSVHLITPDLDDTVILHHFSLTDFETWKPEKDGVHALRVGLLGGTVDVEGTVRPFSDPIALSTRIGIRDLSLEQIMPYIKDTPVGSLSGSLNGQGQVNATLSFQSSLAIASTVRFDVSSRDMDVQMATEGLELELHTEALDIGVSLDSTINTGGNSSRETNFAVTTTLEGTAFSLASGKADFEVLQDALSAEVSGSYSDTGSVDLSQLTANAGLSIKGLIVKGGEEPRELVRLGSFDIAGVEINGHDDIRTTLIRARDAYLLPRLAQSVRKGEPAQTLALKNLEVTGISLSDRSHLAVETVQMESLNTWILKERKGDLEATRLVQGIMGKPTPNASVDTQIKESHSEDSLVIDVENFSLAGENKLTFRDLSVDPPFNFEVDSLSGRFLKLSSREQGASTEITISAGMGKYSAMSINGTLQPPWDTPDMDLHVGLKGIDLALMTPYTTKYLGYTIRSGHLDTKMDIRVEKGVLKSQAVVAVNRIEMYEIEDEQRTEEFLDIPVKTALSMLKDKNDNIHLTLPIEGDMKNPEFSIREVVAAATNQALKKGATLYYQDLGVSLLSGGLIPPGAYTMSGILFSDATTMKFQPVIFDPLSRKLTKPAKEYLDLVAEKLGKKPKVRLVLCGRPAIEDIAALRTGDIDTELPTEPAEDSKDATAETVPSEAPIIEKISLNEKEKTHLIEITKQRAFAVKDYLSETGGLDPERFFICNPDVELVEKGQPPRVDLSI